MAEATRAGDLIDGTFRLLFRHPAALVLPLFPFAAAHFLVENATRSGPAEALAFVLALVGASIVLPAVTRAAFMPLLGEGAPAFGPAFAALAPVRVTAAVVLFVVSLALFLGFAALIVPGLLVAAFLAPVAAVLVAEGTAPVATFRRVRELVRGRYRALLGATLVPVAVAIGFLLIEDAIIPSRSVGLLQILSALILGLGISLGVAYWGVLSAVLYASLVAHAEPPPVAEWPVTTAPPEAAASAGAGAPADPAPTTRHDT